MASPYTRVSRRTEGHLTRSTKSFNTATGQGSQPDQHKHKKPATYGRNKRPRSLSESDGDSINTKKAKIAVLIDARAREETRSRSLVIKPNAPAVASRRSIPQQPKQHVPTATTIKPKPTTQLSPLNKAHEKVANGLKHELNKLQPEKPDAKDGKRKLRSQEGTKFKSELSAYFPEYDEIIGNEPKKDDHELNLDTPIIILDSANTGIQSMHNRKRGRDQEYNLKFFPDDLFDNLHNAHKVDFSYLTKTYQHGNKEDPLSDSYYAKIHRRPERQEKSIRNTERGRAQHEKDQVARLLDGLHGPDWLKLMGVSGVTDSRKKEFEPARMHFIRGCEAILQKFKIWKEEEKRQRLKKQMATAEAEAQHDMGEDGQNEDESDGDPPDYSDVDASAARQLHEEAIARSATTTAKKPTRRARAAPKLKVTSRVDKEFKSFFKKRHLRDASLGKQRRSGRSAVAWGVPIPDLEVVDFDLPVEFRNEETLRVHARKRRRDKRVNKS